MSMWNSLSACLPKSGTMIPIFLFLFSSNLFIKTLSLQVHEPANANARITVMGFVYCDICSNNSFSRHSYFIPGAEVKIDCKFKAISARTREQIQFTVNRTTNRYGVYNLEIPSVDGIACTEATIASSCQASLIWSSSTSCNVPGYKTTTNQIAIKSKQANLCIYSLNALNFKPSKRDITLCGK
ncbi:hypothetical protein Dsin_031134 [Dipteronia sinensis]|uniref:Pollen Ole e 1 allergen and extensin family protein n=1 Tax=Dipteronia sinensis TaxID=43782 RepID=A0AAD9ZKL8_9ROSI|nr:hypothetical protein Dsin_031134 [Dipteronia sinensis]